MVSKSPSGCVRAGVVFGVLLALALPEGPVFAADPAAEPPMLRGTYYDAIPPPPIPLAPETPAKPQEEADDAAAVVSAGLRGGFDSNPTLATGGRGSAYGGAEAAFAAGRSRNGIIAGITGEMSRIQYAAPDLDPAERERLSFQVSNADTSRFALKATTSVSQLRTYNTRAFDAVQSVRAQWTETSLRPFVTAELRYATLNETNAIFPTFLPEDQRFVRATAIPGVAWRDGKSEVGTSLNVSMTRYLKTYDIFGFRRDNERFQPFAFYKFDGEDFTVFASLSRLYGIWHDEDFSDVKRTLYEVEASKDVGKLSLSMTLKRFAAETTFPLSPIVITGLAEGRASWPVSEKTTLTLLARDIETEYLDTPLTTRAFTYGLGITHALIDDYALGLELTQTDATTLAGDPVSATGISVSLSKKIAVGDNKRAASLPPAESASRVVSQPRILPR
jgi:hypothetical protein